MAQPKQERRLKLEELCREYKQVTTLGLARMGMERHPEYFKSLEEVRGIIRTIRGQVGARNRQKYDKTLYTDHSLNLLSDEQASLIASVPKSFADDWHPYEIACDDLFCLFDCHVPYHDKHALEIALEYAVKGGYKNLLIGGDFIDCYMESRFMKEPGRRRFSDELQDAKKVMEILAGLFPGRKIYKLGNHEERHENMLKTRAPEWYDIHEFRLDVLMEFERFGFEKVDQQRVIRYDNLNIIHGHEYRFAISNPVNAARGLFLRSKASTLCGHFHQTSEHTEPTIRDKVVTCWSVGCLCELHPEYMRLNRHNHGFTGIRLDENGYHVENKRIISGKIV